MTERKAPAPDVTLIVTALLLLGTGLVMVASASMPTAARWTGDPLHFFLRQAAYAALACGLCWLCQDRLRLSWLQRSTPWLWLLVVVLLVAVLVPGLGRVVNGSARWLPLGPVSLQVSELAKLVAVVYTASYVQRHAAALQSTALAGLRPMAPLVLMAGLILVEPDLGAAAVLLGTAFCMVYLAGMRLLTFSVSLGGALLVLGAALYASPYRRARLASFMDPWADPYGSGYQLTQSLVAIGRGELFGVGIGESLQKLFYLPEAYTDFVFAVIAEETGLLGVTTLIVLYALLVWRCFVIGRQAEQSGGAFAASLCHGVGVWFALQVLINMGVNMGVLPTKGLTLPLISYGGSSLVVMGIALGLVLRVSVEHRPKRVSEKPGGLLALWRAHG